MTTGPAKQATPDNWMIPPADGWTFDQVKDLDLPFDWELMDGVIMPRGQTKMWHDIVREGLLLNLASAVPDTHRVNVERCVMLDERTVVKPDVVVFDKRSITNIFEAECTPVQAVALAIEVVSPGSRSEDRIRKPARFAEAGVPCYWQVELERDNQLAVHEYWLHADARTYIPAPMHPVHHDKLVTEVPFPIDIDLAAVLEL
jgi:Uma2 family endonuclease